MKATRLPSGKYRAVAYLGKDANGESIRKSFTESSETVAIQKALSYEEKYRNRVTRDTLSVVMSNFLRDREAVLSPSTMADYESRIRVLKRQFPALCGKSIVSVTSDDVQAVINALRNPHSYHRLTKEIKPASEKTIRNYRNLLSAIFKYAGLSLPDVLLPQRERPDLYVPTEDEVRALLAEAKDTDMYVPVALAAFGPLRRGEICGLTYPDDFNGGVVHVHASVAKDGKRAWVRKAPKTYASDRYIELNEWIIEAIEDQGCVTELNPDMITARFSHLLKHAGLPHFRFHDLRHFCVSYLHALGLPDAYIIARTGHGGEEILRRVYRHTLSDRSRQFSDIVKNNFNTFRG